MNPLYESCCVYYGIKVLIIYYYNVLYRFPLAKKVQLMTADLTSEEMRRSSSQVSVLINILVKS
jgi:hypothetical protein